MGSRECEPGDLQGCPTPMSLKPTTTAHKDPPPLPTGSHPNGGTSRGGGERDLQTPVKVPYPFLSPARRGSGALRIGRCAANPLRGHCRTQTGITMTHMSKNTYGNVLRRQYASSETHPSFRYSHTQTHTHPHLPSWRLSGHCQEATRFVDGGEAGAIQQQQVKMISYGRTSKAAITGPTNENV